MNLEFSCVDHLRKYEVGISDQSFEYKMVAGFGRTCAVRLREAWSGAQSECLQGMCQVRDLNPCTNKLIKLKSICPTEMRLDTEKNGHRL